MSFDFNEVTELVEVIKPEMIAENVYKNQSDMVDMDRIKQTLILCIGAGSVGSNLIHSLNKFGYSAFQIYDFDIWEKHNSASSIYPYVLSLNVFEHAKDRGNYWYIPCAFDNHTFDYPAYSPFKVDLLRNHLRSNDPQIYLELYRVPFGVGWSEQWTAFNETLKGVNFPVLYDNVGNPQGRANDLGVFDFKVKDIPTLAVFTTDNLLSRYQSAYTLFKWFNLIDEWKEAKEIRNHFPIIDIRTLDTTKGEMIIFDLFNEIDLLDYFNYSLPIDSMIGSIEELESHYQKDNFKTLSESFQEQGQNQCGNSMSILISQLVSVYATSIITQIRTKGFNTVKKLFLFNASSNFSFVSSMDHFLNLDIPEIDLELEMEIEEEE